MKKKLLLAMLFLSIALSTFAQVTTSNIRGLVVDDQNQPLPGATVVAIHVPTGTKYGGTSNLDGRYNLLNMRVGGPYTVTISYVGYKSQEFKDVFLTLGKTFSLDVKLLSDSQSLDEVVINATGGNNVFGNDRTGAQTSVSRREIARLPTISRSQADFTRLEPSASNGSFGGKNDQYNNFSLDGSIFSNPFGLDAATPGGQTNAQPVSIDAIEQIQVSVAPYDVTLAGFTGASVNAVTKSGTNEFHGTLYGFFRNQDMTGGKIDGDDIFKGKLSQTQYGVSVGGPIVKNKLFFFANFEVDDREDLGSSFAPNRGTGASNESRVLSSDLMAVQTALRNLGYDPGAFENFTFDTGSTKGIFKLDWNINDNNRLALIYNFLDADRTIPANPVALGFRGPSLNTLQFQNAGYQINNELNSVLLELNSTISDKVTNKFQIGYTAFNDFRNPLSVPAPSITIQEGGSNYIIAGHEPFSINNKLDQKVFQMTNNLNIFHKDHTFTVGFSFEKFSFENSFNLGVYGAQGVFFPTSPSVAQFLADAQPGGLIETLLNDATAAHNALSAAGEGVAGGFNLYKAEYGQLAFYLQDEWNASDNFKLTYGVRFDKPLYFNSADLAQDFIETQPAVIPGIEYVDPVTGETRTFDSTEQPSGDFLISPRVGFNWDVKGDDSFQLRGGTGLFSGRLPFVWLGNQTSAPNFFFFQAVDPDFQWPQVWRTNLGIDYKFNIGSIENIIASADLSYTKDINGAHVQNFGLRPPTGQLQGVDNRATYLPTDRVQVFGGPADAFVFVNDDQGRVYNASFKLQKQFENDAFISVGYNYLDSKDVNSVDAEITGDAFAANAARDNVNVPVLSNSRYGDQHRFIAVGSKKWSYSNDKVSTTVSAFYEYAKGGRFSYIYGGDINGDGSGLNDLLYIPTAAEIGSMQFSGAGQAAAFESYIRQDDYLKSRRGQYAERYGALAPWRGRMDLKVIQEFKVSETNAVQISADLLNVGNLISSKWGLVQSPNNFQVLGVSVDGTNTPTYTFDPNLTQSFGFDNTNLQSVWQLQLGLRYIF